MPRDYFAQFTWKKNMQKNKQTKKKNKGEFWETMYQYTSSD